MKWDKVTIIEEDITDVTNQKWDGQRKWKTQENSGSVMENCRDGRCAELEKSSYTECKDVFDLTLVGLE